MYVPLPYPFRSLSRPSSPLRALGIRHAPFSFFFLIYSIFLPNMSKNSKTVALR